jgi:hypothetical protein
MATSKKEAKEISKKKGFDENLLSEEKRDNFLYVKNRILELKESRTNVYGQNIEEIWREADKAYQPYTKKDKGKRVAYLEDEKGWRGVPTVIGGEDDWQFKGSKPNPYIKIQTALGILIDRNPTGVFLPANSKYEKTTGLMKALYQKSWDEARSKQQLKLFVFNMAKYGWAIARTFIFNDKVCRENLDVWNAWIDDMAKPSNPYSVRDWCWRKIYSWDMAKQEFGSEENWKYVMPGGNTDEKTEQGEQKKFQEKSLVEVYFYENRIRDLFMVLANGVPVKIEKMPIKKGNGEKKLSCWQASWTIRHAETPYGIGLFEAIKDDNTALNRIRNMAIDQLAMSIYKPGFYQGTSSLQEGGIIKIKPGIMKQVMDPKNINWMEIPGPGQAAWDGIEMFQDDLNMDSGITDPLVGDVTGKTAFEVAQAKEAALKRLKVPLDNITDALDEDGYITLELMEMIYSVPELIKITDPQLVDDYLKEIKGDEDLYEEIPNELGEREGIMAKVYPEVQLGLEQDDEGNWAQSEQSQFYRLKPQSLEWEGIINIDSQSVLVPSVELSKALDIELMNLLSPMMQTTTAEYLQTIALREDFTLNSATYGKAMKNMLKIYGKTPDEWLPDKWLEGYSAQEDEPLIVDNPQQQAMQQGMQPAQQMPLKPEATGGQSNASTVLPGSPSSIASRIVGQMANKVTGRQF